MLEGVDPATSGIPRSKAEWNAFRAGDVTIPNGEIMGVAIESQDWLDFQRAQKDGWKPLWRDRILGETDEEADAERLREALARPIPERTRSDE